MSKLHLFIPCLMMFSSTVLAVCPPVVPCKQTAEASTIAGSNADQELIAMTQNITSSTNQVAQSIVDSANANASAVQQGTQNLVSTQAQLSQIELNQTMKIKQAMASRAMAHDAELAEQKYRQSVSVVSKDDTKEEFDVMLDALSQNSSLSVPRIINILRVSFDENPDGKVLVPIKGADGICPTADIQNKGVCAIPKKVYPARKLQQLFKECSNDKRALIAKKKNNDARRTAVAMSSKQSAKALATTNSAGSVLARTQKQRVLSCNPTELKNKLCGNEISIEDYQEKIVVGDIIPNGSLSASNFSSPSSSSADGFIDDLTETERAQIRNQSLDRTGLQQDPSQKVVPINNTYRNANQVQAAFDFIDNVTAEDLVPALPPAGRKAISSAEYQARYMARASALSMVRLTLNSSMSLRIGEKMKAMIAQGAFENGAKHTITADSPENKESVMGAGPLDVINDRVMRSAGSLQLGSQSGDAGASPDFVSNPSENDTLGQILESLVLDNDIGAQELLMAEQTLVLKAISVSQKVNSADSVKLMSELRK